MSADLLALVEELTRARRIETCEDGRLIAVATHPPLLTELRQAKSASIGPGNGGKLAHERSTLNIGASELFSAIEREIRDWLLHAGYTPPRAGWPPLEGLLRTWFAIEGRGLRERDLERSAKVLRGWTGAILDLIDPPRRWPLEVPCPECGRLWTEGNTAAGEEPNRALNVIEREPADRSVVTCHACGATWNGVDGAKTLAGLLNKAARLTA